MSSHGYRLHLKLIHSLVQGDVHEEEGRNDLVEDQIDLGEDHNDLEEDLHDLEEVRIDLEGVRIVLEEVRIVLEGHHEEEVLSVLEVLGVLGVRLISCLEVRLISCLEVRLVGQVGGSRVVLAILASLLFPVLPLQFHSSRIYTRASTKRWMQQRLI